ncbi:phage portal protein [Moraxella pluranimalium]|uniref:Phage portal protein n=1 Tax=Moraxella pluranimalium TaxID=470453 RepID=A0A1T0CPG1_9GAMM|nr:phage portal protein [Moraxella pluranimalium]OOS24237.1 phage portal protein [Moraxella pluranimalium]
MSVFNSIKAWFGLAPSDPATGSQYATPITGTPKTSKPVTFDSAMTVSAVFASIRLLAETVASLPLEMYEIDKDGNRTKANHDLVNLLRYRPNARQTRIEFFEQLMLNLVSSGNAYIIKGKVSAGSERIVSLDVINSANMDVVIEQGKLIYRRTLTDSQGGALTKDYTPDEIWHVKLFGTGTVGMSPLAHARKAIAVADSADDKVTSLMVNGAKPTGVLMTKGNPTTEQRQVLREELSGLVSGSETSIPVLPLDMKFEAVSMTPSDIELLSTRRYSIEEIGRIFGVPSILINDSSQSSNWGTGIQSIIDAFYKFNLRPYLEKLELSMLTSLLPRKDWGKYEFEFDADAVLRASFKERVDSYRAAIASGQMTPNEVRHEEGRPQKTGGDHLYMQINMGTLDAISTNERDSNANNTQTGLSQSDEP